jgi:hypothetical protein
MLQELYKVMVCPRFDDSWPKNASIPEFLTPRQVAQVYPIRAIFYDSGKFITADHLFRLE